MVSHTHVYPLLLPPWKYAPHIYFIITYSKLFYSYTKSEHQKYFPYSFASPLPKHQCSKFYPSFPLQSFHLQKSFWAARKNGQKSHEKREREREEKERKIYEPSFHQDFPEQI
jgi:hypothetical protein